MTTNKYSDKVHHGEVKKDAKFPTEEAAGDQNLANQKGMKGAIEILTDKQKQDIEQEAEKEYPYPPDKDYGKHEYKQKVSFANIKRKAYIAGATAHALACIQKDEEIGRLNKELNNLGAEWNLQKEEIARLRRELEKIANPLKYLKEEADKEGAQLNGQMAILMSKDAEWLKSIATEALKQ